MEHRKGGQDAVSETPSRADHLETGIEPGPKIEKTDGCFSGRPAG
jgi:hypothetical protein